MKNNNKISLKTYLSKNKLGIFLYLLTYIIFSAIEIVKTIMLAKVIENISSGNYDYAITLLLISLGLLVFQKIMYYASGWVYNTYAYRIISNLNSDLAQQSFKINSKTYSNYDTGTFVQRIVNDPEKVVDKLAEIIDHIGTLLSALIMLIYISTLNIYIGLILLFFISICGIIERFRIKTKRKNRILVHKNADKIMSLTTEIVKSEKDIKALGLETTLHQISKKYYKEYETANKKHEIVDMNFWNIRNILTNIGSIIILILGVKFIDAGLITLSTFMIVYSNNNSLYEFIWAIGGLSDCFTQIKISCNRMFSLFDNNKFEVETFGNIHKDNLLGKIEFKDVVYSYTDYEKTDDDKINFNKIINHNIVLNNISFKIKPNTTVAFVGKSGSGKSTILNLMSKMLVADSGQILIDDISVTDLDKESLRNSISLVSQFPYIFDMTIKENLLLAKENATDEELWTAIKNSSLEELVNSMPQKLDTKLGESGIKLSGGQRQRLAIARALLRNSSIILFDESTSSLDNFAQEDIKKSIDNLKGKTTVIIVAHRLSTIKNVDKIYFVNEGKIIDEGTFDELFSKNELFKSMFNTENM